MIGQRPADTADLPPADLGGPGALPVHAILRRLVHLTAEFVHVQYIGRFIKVHHHVRSLPRPEARLTVAALALATVVVAALPVLVWVGVHLSSVAFEQTHTIPAVALLLALLAFGAGLAYALAGAAQGPWFLWLIVAAEYIFLVVAIGFAVKPTYLHLVPVLLPVVVGALTPGARPWGQYLVIALCSGIALRVTPAARDIARLFLIHGLRWYMLWAPAAAMLFVLHRVLARRPWLSAANRVLLAAAGTLVFLGAVTVLARPADMVEQLDTSLSLIIGTLSLLWFVLGASFVETGIELAQFARRGLETLAPMRALNWVIGVGWVALVAWVVGWSPAGEHLPVRPATLAVLGVLLVVLAAARRSGRVSRDWLASWFVASAAAVFVLRAYGTIDVREITDSAGVVKERARALGLAGFVYAITWEIVGEVWNVPLKTRRFPRPAPLVLYLAGAVLVSGAALFGIAARLDIFQKYIIVNEYSGALYLSIPLGLLAVARTWRLLPHEVLRQGVTAFYWGAALAVPAFLLRAVAPGPPADAAVLSALALLVLVLPRGAPEMRAPRAAAALGGAAALGLVVSLAQPALVGVLSDLLNLAASLTDSAQLETAARVVLGYVKQTEETPPFLLGYYLGAPAVAIAAASAGAWVNRLRAARTPQDAAAGAVAAPPDAEPGAAEPLQREP